MGRRTFVIAGAGLAGAAAAAQLRRDGFDGNIVLIGAEGAPPYHRPPLSKDYLRGEMERARLDVHGPAFYRDNDIDLRIPARIVGLDAGVRRIVLEDGRRLRFDRLLLATGATARRPDVPGSHLGGIHALRTVDDADAIRDAAGRSDRAVVVGGGWIGAEVTASLRQLGLPVAWVVPGSSPFERLFGPEVGAVYRRLHEAHGVELHTGQHVTAFVGRGAVRGVETTAGSTVEGDLIVVGVGVQPGTDVAVGAGLSVADGILVDEHLRTSAPAVYAAGDVAEAWHPLLGRRIRVAHWDNARRQGRAAARNMLGRAEPYARIPYFYSDQYELSVEYVGHALAWDRVVFRGDPTSGAFIAFWLLDGRVVAGLGANVPRVSDQLAALIEADEPVSVEELVDPMRPLDGLAASTRPARAA